ncbi:universal stress protein [Paraburkholderia humisilvae]|uniref:TRAP-T-associated universal stress protein TeaD n=1 Tax=Paraburkholderia humisilvae TaxID=627669 RepID=A0A6J5E9W5_9BURK|nr:universal stress protein [Paraburkholderia humisilvae]CAB3762657.1 TRAP-T-associated universal stress protein TeaD [Paraburkholderia humisilvae]
MFHTILIAYDGSNAADKAFDYALDLAHQYGANLHVLSVERPPEIAEDIETEALLEQAEAFFEKHFSELRERVGAAGVVAHFNVRVGHPAEQIVLGAEELRADLIVTGHRGRGVFHRWLLGSVSRLVIAYAHCPVMVVR